MQCLDSEDSVFSNVKLNVRFEGMLDEGYQDQIGCSGTSTKALRTKQKARRTLRDLCRSSRYSMVVMVARRLRDPLAASMQATVQHGRPSPA